MAIDTKTTRDRRVLSLRTLDDLRAEIKRVEAGERAGRVRRSGNWTTGQTIGHLAFWLNTVFDGIPGPTPPWLVRFLGPILLKRMFLKGLPAGFRMKKVDGGTYGIDDLPLDEASKRMTAAIDRLEKGTPPDRHVIFGRLTKEEWIQMHLRHAELHLSFLHLS